MYHAKTHGSFVHIIQYQKSNPTWDFKKHLTPCPMQIWPLTLYLLPFHHSWERVSAPHSSSSSYPLHPRSTCLHHRPRQKWFPAPDFLWIWSAPVRGSLRFGSGYGWAWILERLLLMMALGHIEGLHCHGHYPLLHRPNRRRRNRRFQSPRHLEQAIGVFSLNP
jgi:hypothetical protein